MVNTNQTQNVRSRLAGLIGAIVLASAAAVFGQTYTPAPSPFLTTLNNAGAIVVNGCIWTYAAGTTTPIATYADNAGTLNANPIIADNFGRFTVYLLPGVNYKFVYENLPCNSGLHGATLRSADNIPGTPTAAATVDITTALAGETIAGGQCAYLSDGSGSKNAGQWYKCDSTNSYSSLLPPVGIAPAAITSGSVGTVRTQGLATGLSALSIGPDYYVGVAGAITTTAPTNQRFLGRADTATTLVLGPEARPVTAATGLVYTGTGTTARPTFQGYLNSVCDVRLTLTTATPITIADVTGASNVFATPYHGNKCALYDGSANWQVLSFTEITQAIGTVVPGQAYDLFAYNNAGVMATELLEWANATITMTIAAPGVVTWTANGLTTGQQVAFTTTVGLPTGVSPNTVYYVTTVDANTFKLSTTAANLAAGTFITTTGTQSGTHTGHAPYARQTALVLQDGIYVKSGATTRRWLGTFGATSVTTTEDSLLKRDLFNAYNRVDRAVQRLETTTSWTYTLPTLRQANASASNQIEVVVGLSEEPADLTVMSSSTYPTSSNGPLVGLGLDSTTAMIGNQSLATTFNVGGAGGNQSARYVGLPGLGRRVFSWNEAVVNGGTAVTFVSNTNSIGGLTTGSSLQSGIIGRVRS